LQLLTDALVSAADGNLAVADVPNCCWRLFLSDILAFASIVFAVATTYAVIFQLLSSLLLPMFMLMLVSLFLAGVLAFR